MEPEGLLEALGSKYSVQILEATSEPRTAQELSEEFDIPIATCYRRLEDLSEHELLEQTGTRMTEDNRRSKLYRRRVERVCLVIEDDDVSVSLNERVEVESKLDELWHRLRR